MINNKKSDCIILYNYLNGDTKDYGTNCCLSDDMNIECDKEGYITILSL